MKKAEVLKYCDEKSLEGYLTHKMILEIYNDEEDIPDEVVDLVCHKPEPYKPYVMIIGPRLQEAIDMAVTHKILSENINKQ